jgi:carboxyl-terminal processing protease
MQRSMRIVSSLAALGLASVLATTGFGSPRPARPSDVRSTDANITRVTVDMLEHSQFARRPFDSDLAGILLDRYLDSLDGTRSVFLQTDVSEFAAYRATLAKATRQMGDTGAAQAIFRRYLERMEQRTSYLTDTLRTATFDFTGHDIYSFDREHAQRPHDLTAARQLWKQELRSEYLQEKIGGKRPEQIVSALTRRHAQQLDTMRALRTDEVLEVYLDALAHVYDPHSDYLGHEQAESLSIAMNLSLFGIGATLETADGYCQIRALVPGGPAARSGLLKPGDRIVAVAQAGKEPVDIMSMPLSRAVELIRGPKGSSVTLTVVPTGAADGSPPKTALLVRDEINLEDQQAKARIVDLPTAKGATLRLGVIDLPSFYTDRNGHEGAAAGHSATADVARLLDKLKAEKVRGIVLDLRRNGGGSLEQAITLTGLFIRSGPVVQTRGPDGDIEVGADPDPAVVYDGPLVLLTSRLSASASEILVGALQDYGRAVVVGDSSTFGKGTVQSVVPLAAVMDRLGLAHAYDPGAVKITMGKFYRPSGASTQLRGVASDIVLPSTTDFSQVSESALKSPLPWDTVPPTRYEHLNRVEPYLGALKSNSLRRTASDKDFRYLSSDIARLRKSVAEKSISLNEAERREELAQAKARDERREAEGRSLHAIHPTIYEITARNAASPGLPPPMAFGGGTAPVSPTVPASTKDDSDDVSSIRSRAEDDLTLNESVRILADYVDLLR